jgi:hypothetical protein
MNKLSLLVIAFLFSSVSLTSFAAHSVSGYYRDNGTYVEPHESMDPGEARSSGYSYHDNVMVPNNDQDSN